MRFTMRFTHLLRFTRPSPPRSPVGGWNNAACAAAGAGLPPLLRPSFRARAAHWEAYHDEEAEAAHRALLESMLD